MKKTSYIKNVMLPAIGRFIIDTVKSVFSFLSNLILQNSKVVLVLFALLWFYENKVDLSMVQDYLDSSRSQFKEGEVAKVEVDCRDNTAITHRKGKPPKIHTGVKRFSGSQYDDGKITTSFKNKGFGIEPGLVVTTGDGLRLGLDLEYAYWKRWGLVVGTTLPVQERSLENLRGHLGLSYDLPSRWFSHSSLYGGVDTNRTPTFGLRMKFGGGY